MSKSLVEEIAGRYRQKLLHYRNYLHEHPELSFQEVETARFIREKLEAAGIPLRAGITGNSVLGELDSGLPGPTVLFRADIDALPVQEENDWPHRSQRANVMHACGHDMHAAILLCLAEALGENRPLLKRGKVLFAFQQAEEDPMVQGGAKKMIQDGACQGVDLVFALHTGLTDVGTIALATGTASMAVGNYQVTVTGQGGHSGYPHKAIDPVAAVLDIALGIQRLVPSQIDPLHPATVSVSAIQAGKLNAHNIIPETAALCGTVRTGRTEDRDRILQEIQRIAQSVGQMRGCVCETALHPGYPAMYNSEEGSALVRSAARELGIPVLDRPPIMGSEDFSYFQEQCPGAYYSLGCANPDRPETKCPHHSARFMPDEAGMLYGLEMMLEICMRATE